jgi:type II secretory pathway component GspD/PulD (secretin)
LIITLPAVAASSVSAAPGSGSPDRSVSYRGQKVVIGSGRQTPTAKQAPKQMIADATTVPGGALIPLQGSPPVALPVSNSTPVEPSLPPMPPASVPPPAPTITDRGSSVNLDFVDASIVDILKALSIQSGANIVTSPDVTGKTTVTLSHVSLESALDYVCKSAGFQWLKSGNTYIIGTDKSLQPFMPAKLIATERVTKTVQFQNGDPDDLMSSVKAAIPDVSISLIKPGADTSTSSGTGGTTTTTVREKGGVLMVTGLADSVKKVQDFVALAENTFHPSVETAETATYRIKYAYGPNLISVLHSLIPKLMVITGPAQQFESGPQIKFTSGSNDLVDRYTSPSAVKAGADKPGPDEKVDIKLTAPTLLVLSGRREDVTRALDVLSKIDVKPVQLLFEAKVVEVTNGDANKLGLNWDFSGFSTSFGEFTPLDSSGNAVKTSTDYPGQPLKFAPISRSRVPNMATVTLDALFKNDKAKLLARPNVAALDGQKASMFIGDTIKYVESITQTSTGQNITTATINVGVILSLTGRASDDGYITLYLHPEVSSVTQWLAVPGGGSLPQLASRFADTVIRVKDGDTIALGGLIQENDITSIKKVPFLGDLPVLGNFFRDTNKTKNKSEVMFFIKTSLIADHA